ncbi:MAG: LacI family transcriptional regulator [Actinomycetales bacterium]|nr:LacI family transcriptional regulator [Actinomycetales bacterium]
MHDVAAMAGVSIKTVSNVVNGYPYIRPATKQRVEEAIERLGYQLNITARNLRQGRTGMIGLALPELSLPYFAELADSVIAAADDLGLTVLVELTGAVRQREIDVLKSDRRRLSDGLLFSPLALGQEDAGLLDVGYPLVLLGERIFNGPADHVTMANVEAARAATEHLLSAGRRRIALIGAHPGERIGSAGLRETGYRQAIEAAGLTVDPALIVEAGLWHRSTGAEATHRLLDSGAPVDAVFALNDAMALGALHALHDRRVTVPDDVAVIGFDDIDEAKYSTPTLTTVSPGREQIAQTAVDLLRRRIDGTADEPFQQFVADFSIVVRESTAFPL